MIRSAKILLPLIVLVLACAGTAFALWKKHNSEFLNNTRVSGEFIIEKGDSSAKIYQLLFGTLDTPIGFEHYLNHMLKFRQNAKYGYYEADNTTLAELAEWVMTGEQNLVKVTIPEGYNMYNIALALENVEIATQEDMLRVFTDKELITELIDCPYESMEGFLSPGTYFFSKLYPPEKIAAKMVSEFYRTLPENFDTLIARSGLSFYEALTLASIVQKETYRADEAPIVASVYLNRLADNMRLQADPTVIYGIWSEYTGRIRSADLKNAANIYNTYRHKGLPPTPICNPSVMTLEAVANPANTDYFYLVATKKGVHVFSETYAEHRKNVNIHILGRSK